MNPAVLVLSLLLQAPAPAAVPAPEVKPAPTGPVVVFETSLGVIKVALNPDKAPKTVANFLAYVKKGHYNGTIFHRVIPGFMVQGGGMLPDLTEKPAETKVQNEAKNGLRNLRGTIAMARTATRTAPRPSSSSTSRTTPGWTSASPPTAGATRCSATSPRAWRWWTRSWPCGPLPRARTRTCRPPRS